MPYPLKLPSKEILEDLYHNKFMSEVEIGKLYGVSWSAVGHRLRLLGIKTRIPKIRFPKYGSDHYSWKGDKAAIDALHSRVIRLYGKPQYCNFCGIKDPNKRYEWANMSGNYLDVSDYKRLCIPCHRRYDKQRSRER
jgi:hypothetical protein